MLVVYYVNPLLFWHLLWYGSRPLILKSWLINTCTFWSDIFNKWFFWFFYGPFCYGRLTTHWNHGFVIWISNSSSFSSTSCQEFPFDHWLFFLVFFLNFFKLRLMLWNNRLFIKIRLFFLLTWSKIKKLLFILISFFITQWRFSLFSHFLVFLGKSCGVLGWSDEVTGSIVGSFYCFDWWCFLGAFLLFWFVKIISIIRIILLCCAVLRLLSWEIVFPFQESFSRRFNNWRLLSFFFFFKFFFKQLVKSFATFAFAWEGKVVNGVQGCDGFAFDIARRNRRPRVYIIITLSVFSCPSLADVSVWNLWWISLFWLNWLNAGRLEWGNVRYRIISVRTMTPFSRLSIFLVILPYCNAISVWPKLLINHYIFKALANSIVFGSFTCGSLAFYWAVVFCRNLKRLDLLFNIAFRPGHIRIQFSETVS